MDARSFSVTFDYRCPFARNAHEHLALALQAGAAWQVRFVPFSLSQAHVEEGQPPVWEDPAKRDGLLALEVGVALRQRWPEQFLAGHLALFAARHDRGLDIRQRPELERVLGEVGVDPDAVFAEVEAGWPLKTVAAEHQEAVEGHSVFGVPTFILGDRAAFVRLMTRPGRDAEGARRTIEGVLDLVRDHPELNELKHTRIDR
jgi:hypothetical protein